MALFKRKKEVKELKLPEAPVFPELPSFPSLPALPAEEKEAKLAKLPTLPTLPTLPQLPTLPSIEEKPITFIPQLKPPTPEITAEEKEIPKAKEQIFVKIDRFKDALTNFELIKKKLQQTSSLLEKIRETRAKEEEELNLWQEELDSIKTKIFSIDKKLFSSLE